MTQTYPFREVAGHLIASVDGLEVLIDTGSPVSFGRGVLTMGRDPKPRRLEADVAGFTIDDILREIRRLPGAEGLARLDALIGRDILGGCDLSINWPEGKLNLRPDTQRGIPSTQAFVDGDRVRVIFDTGAPLSYISPRLARGEPRVGQAEDFYPLEGTYKVDLVEKMMAVGWKSVYLPVAVAPPFVEALMGGADAIIGTDVLKQCGPLCIRL